MIAVSFDMDAVEKWANFSGDYNPIHFDLNAAARVINKGLVVHGMLVLLPVKQAMTRVAPPPPTAGHWTRLQSAFRNPVPQSRDLAINIRQGGPKTRFAVLSEADETVHFEGVLSSGLPPEPLVLESEVRLDRKELLQRWEYFVGSFPEIGSTWIFLDAILFGEFVNRDASDLISTITGEDAAANGFETSAHVVVQTSQCVWFDHSVLENFSFPQSFDLVYRYALADRMTDGNRVIGKVELEAWLNDKRVLRSDVGLMLDKSGLD